MPGEFANLNELWSRTLVETLKAKGVRFAVVCPGSRSSPLAFAFARTEGIEAIPVLDERSASFFALGIAKREDAPVAVVCTSGTAAANFFPAVIEAAECGVPLVVLTADRPPELRNCRAGQTIDQVKLYGAYPVSQVELSLPENSVAMLKYLRQTVSVQVDKAMVPFRGPVHLNVPFRDPLPPIEDNGFESAVSSSEWKGLFSWPLGGLRAVLSAKLDLSSFANTERGLLLVGTPLVKPSGRWLDHVAAFASALKWPVLADGLNPLRNHASQFPWLVTGYNAICRGDLAAMGLLPEKVVVIGDLPLSKTLRSWLGRENLETLFLAPSFEDFDSNRSDSKSVCWDFNHGTPDVGERAGTDFAQEWKNADEKAQAALQKRLDAVPFQFEGAVARTLSQSLPEGSALFVSNSTPPRDLDLFWEASDRAVEVYSSRGANGIDGILSTALGIAHRGGPSFLLTGDLALLHDSNGGLVSRKFSGSLTILLINNGGGGIFELLPVAQFGEEFETFFATDQKTDFAKWAATYDIGYQRARDLAELEALVREAPRPGVRLIEIVTDRKRDAAERRRIVTEIAAELANL